MKILMIFILIVIIGCSESQQDQAEVMGDMPGKDGVETVEDLTGQNGTGFDLICENECGKEGFIECKSETEAIYCEIVGKDSCFSKVTKKCGNEDFNPCKVSFCDPDKGCVTEYKPDGSKCVDNDPCTVGEVCKNGVCMSENICECNSDDDCNRIFHGCFKRYYCDKESFPYVCKELETDKFEAKCKEKDIYHDVVCDISDQECSDVSNRVIDEVFFIFSEIYKRLRFLSKLQFYEVVEKKESKCVVPERFVTNYSLENSYLPPSLLDALKIYPGVVLKCSYYLKKLADDSGFKIIGELKYGYLDKNSFLGIDNQYGKKRFSVEVKYDTENCDFITPSNIVVEEDGKNVAVLTITDEWKKRFEKKFSYFEDDRSVSRVYDDLFAMYENLKYFFENYPISNDTPCYKAVPTQHITPTEGTCCGSLGGPATFFYRICDPDIYTFYTGAWLKLDFASPDYHYALYSIDRSTEENEVLYTFSAFSDFDCDGIQSTFQLIAPVKKDPVNCEVYEPKFFLDRIGE